MGLTMRVVGIGLVLGVFAVTPAAAQECARCYDSESGSAHVFGSAGSWYSYFHADCNAFNGCHGNSQYGGCGGNHFGCGVSLAMLVERLNTGIVRGDVTRVGALVAANPTRVRYDPVTGRVTVRDCDQKALMEWSWQAPAGRAVAAGGSSWATPLIGWRAA